MTVPPAPHDWFKPAVLYGKHIRLEPLEPQHYAALYAALEPEIYGLMPHDPTRNTTKTLADFVAQLEWPSTRMVFVVIEQKSGAIVGSSSLFATDLANKGVEIGATWYASRAQGTFVNPESKMLLLELAFEVWGVIRVQLKTHHLNTQSQRAIEKLGATREGILRNHMIYEDGSLRHSVMYSILPEEWEGVKKRLLERIN
jgi:N-acetyltransferase